MKYYRKYFVFGIIIALVAIVALWPRIAEIKAKHDIGNAMEATLVLVEPNLIFDDIEPISVECRDVMFFTTLCKSELFFGTSTIEETAEIRQGLALKDIENYILKTSATLRKHDWSEYEYKADPNPEGATSLYFIHSKKFGSVSCEVLSNYSSIDSVSGKSPSFHQSITCSKELGSGIF